MNDISRQLRIVGFRVVPVPKDTKFPNLGTRDVEFVDITSVGNAKYTVIPMRIQDAMRDTTGLWAAIEPAYNAWKKGMEVPTTGTPLTSWHGITREQIEAVRVHGLYTVEDVAQMTDAILQKVGGIGMHAVREAARSWDMAKDTRAITQDLAAKDAEIDALKQQMADLMEMMQGDPNEEPVKRRPGRPRKDESEAA